MQIIVLADALQRVELSNRLTGNEDIIWIGDEREFLDYKEADAFIDLEFVYDADRIVLLAGLLPKLVIVNSVTNTLEEINPSFFRINGWPTFLSSDVIEAAGDHETAPEVEKLFGFFHKKIEWLTDQPGFITPRVVSMIINEAFICLGEGVSTKEEINTAMKLGTAYPYGPFEWAEKIGLQNIVTLLDKLKKSQTRYKPSEYLVQETNKAI